MFQIIQACCHAVEKVIQTAFPFFASLRHVICKKKKKKRQWCSTRLTITTTWMENGFEIKKRGVKEWRIWRDRRRWEEEKDTMRGQKRESILLVPLIWGNQINTPLLELQLIHELFLSNCLLQTRTEQQQISGHHDEHWHRVYWDKGLMPLPTNGHEDGRGH